MCPEAREDGLRFLWLLEEAQRPSRYLGNEVNSIRKPWESVDLRVALVFPDVYEVGMSHVGIRILYHILNSLDWALAERVFSPWVDLERRLMESGLPLVSLESKRPLRDFNIIGFSLQQELCLTNVLSILSLSGLSFRAQDRKEEDPLVIAGGPTCFNPEPFCEVFDAILVGEGEDAIVKISEVVREAKRGKASKSEILKALTRIRGVYVPIFFRPRGKEPSRLEAIEPLLPGYEKVEKAVVPDLDGVSFPQVPIVPFTQLVHDRLVVEIARGCGRGCRFCQAGFIYRPLRERSVETILRYLNLGIRGTGYEEISLLSLSSGDYSCFEALLRRVMDGCEGERIALSLPSLRVDTMSPQMVSEIKRVRKTGFTIAPETGDEGLRFRLNKGLRDQEILEIARLIFEAGWQVLKLYFMVGLPFEEEASLEATREFLFQILKKVPKKGKLNVNISCFVPKSHTPFQWESQISSGEYKRRIEEILSPFRRHQLAFKGNPEEISLLEGVFSRGDRRLLNVAIRAFKKGARYDAWKDMLQLDLWMEAFKEEGVDPRVYMRRRDPEEILPWEHLDSGVSKGFLLGELRKAHEGRLTSNCVTKCEGCGVCKGNGVKVRVWEGYEGPQKDGGFSCGVEVRDNSSRELSHAYRLRISKVHEARFLGHLEYVRAFLRAIRRAGLRPRYSKGFHPMPKVKFMRALPLGVESLCELCDLELLDPIAPDELKMRLNRVLPQGIRVLGAEALGSPKTFPQIKRSVILVRRGHDQMGGSSRDMDWKGTLIQRLQKGSPDMSVEDMKMRSNSLVLVFSYNSKLLKPLQGYLGGLGGGFRLVKIRDE